MTYSQEFRVTDNSEYKPNLPPGYVIETHYPDGWTLPDWEEMGYGELEGPFATRAQAQAALEESGLLTAWY